MVEKKLHSQNIVACIWDFDKTLISGYMQVPIFERYGIDEKTFWEEVNLLPEVYRARGQQVSYDTIYLNHLLSYVKNGPLKGLSNSVLRELGQDLVFYPGLPEFFGELKALVNNEPEFKKFGLSLEHYIISTGLSEMIKGSAIASYVDGIYGCELIENPMPPGFAAQQEFEIDTEREVSQIGAIVDNTIKTRYIFEINKGTNKNSDIGVNAKIDQADRRIPIKNMIYVADGPSDVPVFSVVKKYGGKTFAVYDPESQAEFSQNDSLLQVRRIHAYGPANYTDQSSTYMWIKMHLQQICTRVVQEEEWALANKVAQPPKHLHKDEPPCEIESDKEQPELF